jgi:hypothetical protein
MASKLLHPICWNKVQLLEEESADVDFLSWDRGD